MSEKHVLDIIMSFCLFCFGIKFIHTYINHLHNYVTTVIDIIRFYFMLRPFLLSCNIRELMRIQSHIACKLKFILNGYRTTLKTTQKLTILQTLKNVLEICDHIIPY